MLIGFPLKRLKREKIELARKPNRNNMLDSRLSATPQGNSLIGVLKQTEQRLCHP